MNKVVFITGAAKGLGLATSKILLTARYTVVGIGRKSSRDFSYLMTQFPENAYFYDLDFINVDGISQLVKRLIKEHGRPYGLINNAAVGHDGVLATMHESDITSLIRINIEAPIVLTKYVSRSMLLNREGRIVNVGSIIGATGFNGLSVYGASKAALGGFTKSLARELGKANITVNTLAPGYMQTAMTEGLEGDKLASIKRRSPLGRLASVDDAAEAIKYLLSSGAGSVTGTTITVDGGSTA